MSYAMGAALQTAVFQRLSSEAALFGAMDGAVFDAIPDSAVPDLFVALGAEVVRDRSDVTGAGAEHDFAVSVVSAADGFVTAKQVAGRATDSLLGAPLALSRGRVVYLNFLKARARRVTTDDTRRIDLWFRARLEDDL